MLRSRTRERDENIADEQKHGERGFHETSDDDAQLSGLVPIAFKEDGGQYLAAQPQLSNLLSVASEAGAQRSGGTQSCRKESTSRVAGTAWRDNLRAPPEKLSETERRRDRQAQRDGDKDTERQRDTEAESQRETERDRDRERERERE